MSRNKKDNQDDFSIESLFTGVSKIEPHADMREGAQFISQMVTAFVDEGFSRQEGISMAMQMVLNAGKQ